MVSTLTICVYWQTVGSEKMARLFIECAFSLGLAHYIIDNKNKVDKAVGRLSIIFDNNIASVCTNQPLTNTATENVLILDTLALLSPIIMLSF